MLEQIKELELVNKELAKLKLLKEELESILLSEFHDHPYEGQRTYEVDAYKVTIKTGINYKIDRERYQELHIPSELNPVREVLKLEIDLKKVRELKRDHALFLSEFITETPSKPTVVIGDRI